MRCNKYKTIEYGGKHSGSTSYEYTSDELILEREDIAFVLKSLRRGNENDKAFASRMFNTLCPVVHCESCGRRMADDDSRVHKFGDRTLCHKCWFAIQDIEYCLDWMKWFPQSNPLYALKSLQKKREEWCLPSINYLVNENTYGEWFKKYKSMFLEHKEKEGENK